jgi:hypothetical protein
VSDANDRGGTVVGQRDGVAFAGVSLHESGGIEVFSRHIVRVQQRHLFFSLWEKIPDD